MQNIELLCFEIVQQAFRDYDTGLRASLKEPKNEKQLAKQREEIRYIKECESFFKSSYYRALCDYPGKKVIAWVRYHVEHYTCPIFADKKTMKKRKRKIPITLKT